MGDRYGRSDISEISIGISIWDMGYRYGVRSTNMIVYHIDMVILDIDTGYGLMIWETRVSIWSSPISIWDISSLCLGGGRSNGSGGLGSLSSDDGTLGSMATPPAALCQPCVATAPHL